jgi:hypothetical protein
MGTVLEFKKNNITKPVINIPVNFWDRFKEVLRKYYSENDVHLIVAAIMDKECYERTNDDIRKVADIYYRFAPEK